MHVCIGGVATAVEGWFTFTLIKKKVARWWTQMELLDGVKRKARSETQSNLIKK